MPFRAYFETDTGRLVSVTTIWPESVPAGIDFIEYQADLNNVDIANWMWDPASRSFVPRPPKVLVDRLQDIIENSAYADDIITLWQSLNASRRAQLRNGLIRLLGKARWRAQLEPLTVDPE